MSLIGPGVAQVCPPSKWCLVLSWWSEEGCSIGPQQEARALDQHQKLFGSEKIHPWSTPQQKPQIRTRCPLSYWNMTFRVPTLQMGWGAFSHSVLILQVGVNLWLLHLEIHKINKALHRYLQIKCVTVSSSHLSKQMSGCIICCLHEVSMSFFVFSQ